MLSARSVVIFIVAAISLGLTINVISLSGDPDSDGVGRDSFGIRAHGHRGVFEVLNRVGVSATRKISPVASEYPQDATVALIAPSPRFVSYEPAYLQQLARWVEEGGRIVVAPRTAEATNRFDDYADAEKDFPKPTLFESLGIGEVEILGDPHDTGGEEADGVWESLQWRESRAQRPLEQRSFRWEQGGRQVDWTLAMPVGEALSVDPGETAWQPVLTRSNTLDEGDGEVLAASFQRGKGEIVVVADPDLFTNALLGQADNAVAVVGLLSPAGGSVLFDEHYHGLSVRGNALYLLTYPGFAALTLSVLAAVCVWAWRTAVALGPPVATPAKPRRDLREYIRAMGRLFLRSRDGRRFLLAELRQGVIEELGRQLNLPPLITSASRIAAAIARRDRGRSENFTAAIDAIDNRLAKPGQLGRKETTQLMQGVTSCL